MKVNIKNLENGWLVHYERWGWNMNVDRIKIGEGEKAFTYAFNDEIQDTWKKVTDFIHDCFFIKGKKEEDAEWQNQKKKEK